MVTLISDMHSTNPKLVNYQNLRATFGPRLQENVPLARYTAARVGGPADGLLIAETVEELVEIAIKLWEIEVPFTILGGGSNILVSDAGVRRIVVINRARRVLFDTQSAVPSVWAESGANFGSVARQAAPHGLAGLEWAASIPGTIGGAVVGNAGAYEKDMSGSLVVAEILQHQAVTGHIDTWQSWREEWPVERFAYGYRDSLLKKQPGHTIVLAARLCLEHSTPEAVQAKMDTFIKQRHSTQPPGASMGSMFKNPPGDYAGRLIEAAGLKGTRVGDAVISPLHANFFINQGQATASDIRKLIDLARQSVAQQFGITLELEIELVGE